MKPALPARRQSRPDDRRGQLDLPDCRRRAGADRRRCRHAVASRRDRRGCAGGPRCTSSSRTRTAITSPARRRSTRAGRGAGFEDAVADPRSRCSPGSRWPTATSSPTDEGDLRSLHTPGHAPDHSACGTPSRGRCSSATCWCRARTVVIPASHGGSLVDVPGVARAAAAAQAGARAAGARPGDRGSAGADPPIHRASRASARSRSWRRSSRRRRPSSDITVADLSRPAAALMPMARESVLAHLHEARRRRHARRRPRRQSR